MWKGPNYLHVSKKQNNKWSKFNFVCLRISCEQVLFFRPTTKRNLRQQPKSRLVQATEAQSLTRGFIWRELGAFPVSEAQDIATREFLSSEGQNLRKIRSQQTLHGSVTFETKSLWGAEQDAFSERSFASHCHTDWNQQKWLLYIECKVISAFLTSLVSEFISQVHQITL